MPLPMTLFVKRFELIPCAMRPSAVLIAMLIDRFGPTNVGVQAAYCTQEKLLVQPTGYQLVIPARNDYMTGCPVMDSVF